MQIILQKAKHGPALFQESFGTVCPVPHAAFDKDKHRWSLSIYLKGKAHGAFYPVSTLRVDRRCQIKMQWVQSQSDLFILLQKDALNPFSIGWRVPSETDVACCMCCQVMGSWKTCLMEISKSHIGTSLSFTRAGPYRRSHKHPSICSCLFRAREE